MHPHGQPSVRETWRFWVLFALAAVAWIALSIVVERGR